MDRIWRVAIAACCLAVASPAFAQMSLVGEWSPRYHEDQPDRIPGPELGDYTGLPITDGARLAADSWDASRLTLREHQCKVHNGPYILHGPIQFRIWEEKDLRTQQVIALRIYLNTYEQERTIWMDGRPHPPEWAPHTWQGFSTGKWEGAMLTVIATHLKDGYVALNGVGSSDVSTVIEHFVRHGDYLTQVTLVIDPVYLAEPFIKTSTFVLDPKIVLPRYPCGPNEVVVEIPRPRGQVPHWLPGANHFLSEFAIREGLPYDAVRGYDESLYPEYMEKLKAMKPATATNAAAAK